MFQLHEIGIIHSPFKELTNMPIQPNGAKGVISKILINDKYSEGLVDLDGFSHIFLIYILHKSKIEKLKVIPFMDTVERGIFSTRSPLRPNHIGISIVKLIEINKNIITVEGADVLDGTPLIDIKPYFKNVDCITESKSGWLKLNENEISTKRSDHRFIEN